MATDPEIPTPANDAVQHQEDLLDEALEESFPASDPPSVPHTPAEKKD
ncbi:MAG TPA: hypothetical protein VF459_00595 [Caulobacteraceae bacterium]